MGVASGSGWNLWVWLMGVVLRRYIDFLILLIPTPLVSVLFCSSIPTFLFIFKNVFRSLVYTQLEKHWQYLRCVTDLVPLCANSERLMWSRKLVETCFFCLYIVKE